MERIFSALPEGDKLPSIGGGSTWTDLRFFFSFVRMGDFVEERLGLALKHVGLNLTEVMICVELAVWRQRNPNERAGVSLKELTVKTAAPRARLHAQLKVLVSMGLVAVTQSTSSVVGVGPGYVLTAAGLEKCGVFAKAARSAEAEVYDMLFNRGKKRFEAWVQMNHLLNEYLSKDKSK